MEEDSSKTKIHSSSLILLIGRDTVKEMKELRPNALAHTTSRYLESGQETLCDYYFLPILFFFTNFCITYLPSLRALLVR